MSRVLCLWFTGLVLATRSVGAHHSFAMYDNQRLLTVKGVVKSFQWSNPHAVLWLLEDTGDGNLREWTVELPTSPGGLTRLGWTKRSLAPGDRVIVELNPLRSGERGGSFKKATLLSTGAVLTASPTPAPSPSTP